MEHGATIAAAATMKVDPVAAQAAASLQLLLHEDPTLVQFGLTTAASTTTAAAATAHTGPDAVAFPYAASLLQQQQQQQQFQSSSNSSSSNPTTTSSVAVTALQEVERKLALTESLAVKLSRTSPEAVTGHLLRLHGYNVPDATTTTTTGNQPGVAPTSAAAATVSGTAALLSSTTNTLVDASTTTNNNNTSLTVIRDRAARLERSAETLDVTCARVETSVTKALAKLQTSTATLERVLNVSRTLKLILRLQFETAKLLSYDLEDVRDLTRAAAAVAVLEDVLQQQQQQQSPTRVPVAGVGGSNDTDDTDDTEPHIAVVERMRPTALATARAVRRAASVLLQEQQTASTTNLPQLGAVLQVYFSLGELPAAVWQVVDYAHALAVTATRQLFNPVTIQQLNEQVSRSAQAHKHSSSSIGIGNSGSAGNTTSDAQRDVAKFRKQVRATVTVQWAQGILEAATRVRNVHRILQRKTDPVTRTPYLAVVAAAGRPDPYRSAPLAADQKRGPPHSVIIESSYSVFDLFWGRFCQSLATTIETLLEQQTEAMTADIAALYPAVRAAALEMVSHLQESNRSTITSISNPGLDDSGALSSGILGGSAALNDPFLDRIASEYDTDNPQSAASASAETWTVVTDVAQASLSHAFSPVSSGARDVSQLLHTMSAQVTHSPEWKSLGTSGLIPLQNAFLQACHKRLSAPLQYMFPQSVAMDDEGVAISSGMAILPSKYDIQRFDENIRQELSLADPREGGGDLTAVTMIAECVVSMISEFCVRTKSAMSGVGETGYVNESDWSMTESLQHDRKVVVIMYTLKQYLQSAPDKTFVAPYRPAVLPQHLDAANLCSSALSQSLVAIDNTVKYAVLLPLCRVLNRRIGAVLAKMHSGVYLEASMKSTSAGDGIDDGNAAPSFVQNDLAPIFEMIAEKQLARFPPVYASVIAANVTAFTMYTFLSSASLIRPLPESARLHLTQDLADLEMALEQLVTKTGSTLTLHQVENGKPYSELRAFRQMLFWTGLDNASKPADEVAKSLLREVWTKDTRASTMFHFLFSFGPSMLSSPHHTKRVNAADYVHTLVQLDGSTVTGEDTAWMTIMSCCDSYVQRASAAPSDGGDPRIAQIVMFMGQELLRRRGRN